MQNDVNAVNKQQNKAYRAAREIFFQQPIGKHLGLTLDMEKGLRIRAALYVIINRNPTTRKQFKTRKRNGEIFIWRTH